MINKYIISHGMTRLDRRFLTNSKVYDLANTNLQQTVVFD